MENTVLISDFDGTISKKDFFWYAIENLLEKTDIQPWNDYKNGRITHFEALRRIFSKIRSNKEAFDDFIFSLPIEECFVDTVKYCKTNAIDFYIVSAGADYYIELILRKLKVFDDIKLIANKGVYSQEKGLEMFKPDASLPYYSENYGVGKGLFAADLRKKYDKIVFAGDGNPDIEVAKFADVVFARDTLLKLCKDNNITTKEFNSYCNILEYLKNG